MGFIRFGSVMGDIGTNCRHFPVRDAYWLAISPGTGGDLCFWFDVGLGVTGCGPGLVFEVTAQSEMVGRQAANSSSFVRHIYLPSAHIHSFNRRLDSPGGRVVELGSATSGAAPHIAIISLTPMSFGYRIFEVDNIWDYYFWKLNEKAAMTRGVSEFVYGHVRNNDF